MMRKYVLIGLPIVFVVSIFVVPIIINESYKINSGYITLWGAKDLLSYFGTAISAVGTLFIGIIAFEQNKKANSINDRLLKLQEINSTPFFHIDLSGSKIQCFRDREIDILIGIRNESSSVINILEVSEIKIRTLSNQQVELPFCKGWTTHYSVLPHQTKELNFFKEIKQTESPIFNATELFYPAPFEQLISEVKIKMQFVNSVDIYMQKMEFYLYVLPVKEKDNKYELNISNIENSIEKI